MAARKRKQEWSAERRIQHSQKIRAALAAKAKAKQEVPLGVEAGPTLFVPVPGWGSVASGSGGGGGRMSHAFDEQRDDPLIALVGLYDKGLIDADKAMETVRRIAVKP